MEIHAAESADRSRVRSIAHDSLRSSYSLSPQQIESILEGEFSDERLADRFADPDVTVYVAEASVGDTREVEGFVDVDTADGRRLRWLHVDPEARGNGIGTALLERVAEDADGAPLTAHVLEEAVEGGKFLEGFGLESDGTETAVLGGEEFSVVVFTGGSSTGEPNEPSVSVPESVEIDGTAHPVDRDEPIPGRSSPFFPVYTTDDRTERYGYFCSNCGSMDVSADGLDRLECGECGNAHRADEWDDSYL
jgi:GNAT superfamily N-acetyltransferase/ribosomal protein S27AE